MKKFVSTFALLAAIVAPAAASAQQTLRLNTRDLYDVAWAYREFFVKSAVPAGSIGWTGSTAGCSAGGVPAWIAFKNVQAVNWYRAMAGVSAEDTPLMATLPQAASMLVLANGGPKIDGSGQATTTSAYTACGPTANSATMTSKGIGFAGGNAWNVDAIQAQMAESGSAASNTQLKNRMELLRITPSQHAIGMSADGTGVSIATIASTPNPTLFAAPVQRDWPRQGFFPASLMPSRVHSTGYARGVATSFNATIDGVSAGVTPLTSNVTDYEGRNFVSASIAGLPVSVIGSDRKTVAITQSNVIVGSPLGTSTSRTYTVNLFDPTSMYANILEPGWYWNVDDGGVGVSIEQQGSQMFIAMYSYRSSDRSPIWHVGSCAMLPGNEGAVKYCGGQFEQYAGGKTLAGTGGSAASIGGVLNFDLQWSDNTAPKLTFGANSMQLTRFKPAGGNDQNSAAQTGWYWDRVGGEGWFFEIANERMFAAAYAYDAAGQPIWFIASGDMTNKTVLDSVPLQQCRNGRALTEPAGSRKIADGDCQQVSTLSLNFTGPDRVTAVVGGRSIALTRFWFNRASTDASVATY